MSLRIGIGTNLRIQGAGGLPYPDVLLDGNTVGFYDYLLGVTMDGANLVSAWNSIIGANHLLQTGADAIKPVWSADGVLFDGAVVNGDYMKCVAFTWNQPEFIYMVMRQVTWTITEYFFDGDTNNKGMARQDALTPGIKAYAGTMSIQNDNLAVNTWGIIRVLFNGASSKLIVNETAPTLWNCGVNNMGGFTLATRGDTASLYSNIQVKEIINRSSVDGETEIYTYLAAKYSI